MERLATELLSQYKVVYSRPESLIPPEKVERVVGTARGDDARRASSRGERRLT